MNRSISVALVEDDGVMRGRLVQAILGSASLQLAHAADTVADVVSWLRHHAADVLLVDLGLPDGSGFDVIRACRLLQPATEVMVLTMFADESSMVRAFEAGARGYLLKDGTEVDLCRHIEDLYVGGSPMSPIIARLLLTRWARAGEAASQCAVSMPSAVIVPALTAKERQVLDLVSRGFTYNEVAGQAGVSVSTVRTHVRNIYAKLEVHNKAEALYEARLLGLLK